MHGNQEISGLDFKILTDMIHVFKIKQSREFPSLEFALSVN